MAPVTQRKLTAQPNAGLPREIHGRKMYMASPDYMAKYAKRLIQAGAKFVGGCCGTTPEHIRAMADAVHALAPRHVAVRVQVAEVPRDVQVVEVHDAAASAEIQAYEQVRLCGEGEAVKLIAEKATTLGGRVPVNTSGGLECRGHPVGATGLAQVVELTWQLRGQAGDRQVPGAKVGLAQNAGGHLGNENATCAITILTT